MPDAITNILNKITEFWKQLDKSQKIRIYITGGVLLAVIIFGLYFTLKSNYVLLIRDAQEDLKAITEVLDSKGIKYKANADGSIYVDKKNRDAADVALVMEGLPKGSMTFENAWGSIKLNTTESDKKKLWENYGKAELEAKIKMLDNVKNATVSISLPEKSVYVKPNSDTQKGKAYVTVVGDVNAQQVQGIVMLVASSFVDLDPQNVTVGDEYGNILNAKANDSSIDMANTHEEMRTNKALQLESEVKKIYNVGPSAYFDTLVVTVNPILDFDKLIMEENGIKNPDGMDEGALISSQEIKESVTNGSANGTAGIDSNPGTPSYQTGQDSNSDYNKSDKTANYEYTRYIKQSEKAVGKMLMDESTMTIALWYGNRIKDATALDENFLNQVKVDASRATGIPTSNISVSTYKMAEEVVPVVAWTDTLKEIIDTYGLFALILFLTIGLLIAAVPRKKPEEDIAELEPAMAGGPTFISPEEHLEEIDLEEKSEVKKQIDKFVKQKPDAVAQLLRNWLADDWD